MALDERGVAQRELKNWSFLVGHGIKQDDVEICPRCHSKIHPQHSGHADYIVDVRTGHMPLSLRVECKAARATKEDPTGGLYGFAQFKDNQHQWMQRWMAATGSDQAAWVWLQFGADRVDAVSPWKRQVYLVSYCAYLEVQFLMLREANLRSLPMNALRGITRVEVRDKKLHADVLLAAYALVWQGANDWWLPESHPFWKITGVSYYDFATAHDWRAAHARPD